MDIYTWTHDETRSTGNVSSNVTKLANDCFLINNIDQDTYVLFPTFAITLNVGETVRISFDVEYDGDDRFDWGFGFFTSSGYQNVVHITGAGHYETEAKIYQIRGFIDDAHRTIMPSKSFTIKNLKVYKYTSSSNISVAPSNPRRNIDINVETDPYVKYQYFEDSNVGTVAKNTWGNDTGVFTSVWQNSNLDWSSTPFAGNTTIAKFNEMGDMTVSPTNFGTGTLSGDIYGQFINCTNLTEATLPNCSFDAGCLFNLSGIVTVHSKANSKPTSALSMFRKCYDLVTLPYIDFSECKSIRNFCYNDAALTTLGDGITFPEVTDAYDAFNGCTSLTSLPAGFTLPKVTDANSMFSGCTSLTALPSGFALPNVTTATYMFANCRSLTALPSGFTLPNVTNAYGMFSGCTSLTALPSGFAIPNVTIANNMFINCTGLTALPSGFTLPKVTDANSMFSGCTGLTALPSEFAIPNVIAATYMFSNCTGLTSLPSGFTLPEVTNAYNMFSGCTGLTALPSGFAIPNVTIANNMFRGCTSLTTVGDFAISSSAGTSNYYVFRGCTSLTTVGNVYIPNGAALFQECSNLVSVGDLDIHRSSKADVGAMFYQCGKLQSIGNITCTNCTWTNTSFTNTYALTTIGGMTGLSSSVSLSSSSNLTPLSVHNIINTATGGTSSASITLTLHATAKANWQASEYYAGDTGTAAAKYITIA